MNLTWKTKLAAVVAAIIVLAGLLLVIKYQRDIINKQEAIQKSVVEMKQLPNNVARAETQYVTSADLNKFANSLDLKLGPIRDDLSSLNASVKGIQVTKIISSGSIEKNLSSDKTEVRKDPVVAGESLDKYGYLKYTQVLALEEPFSDGKRVPFGKVKFNAWKDKPWDLTVDQRQYTVVNVLGQDEDGKHYTYSKFSVSVGGKSYDLKIDNSKFQEELPQSKFRFSPRLMLGLNAGTTFNAPKFELIPDLELALFSYGQAYPSWEFLGLGAGFDVRNNKFQFLVSPFSYNVGENIPFMRNLYVGPAISFSTSGEFSILGGIRVGL